MAITAWDLVSGVYDRVGSANLASSLSENNIYNLAIDATRDTEQFLGVTIGSTAIDSKYVPAISNLSAAYAVAHTLGADIDTEVSVGDIRIGYRDINLAEQKQIDFFNMSAESSLEKLAKQVGGAVAIRHAYTEKVV